MSRTNQILGAVVLVQIGLIALVWSSGDERSLAKLEPIISIAPESITRVEIFDRRDGKGEAPAKADVVLDKGASGWVLSSHFNYPAKPSAIEALIGKLENLKSRGPVTTREARHRQLRVSADRYERKLVVHAGGEPVTLYLGTAAGRGKTAVRVDGDDAVFGAAGLTSYSVGAAPRTWVETEYFTKGPDAITSLVVTNANGTFDLRRADGEAPWKRFEGEAEVAAPAGKELHGGAVDAAAGTLSRLTLWAPADPAKAGFTPLATAVFKAGEATHTLKIGPLADNRYLAVIDDKSPVFINKASLDAIVELGPDKLYREPPADDDAGGLPPTGPGGAPELPPGLTIPGAHGAP